MASGLLLLLAAVFTATVDTAIKAGLGLLLLAAVGGFYLLSLHVRGQKHPKIVVVAHASLAVIGVLLLLGSTLALI